MAQLQYSESSIVAASAAKYLILIGSSMSEKCSKKIIKLSYRHLSAINVNVNRINGVKLG